MKLYKWFQYVDIFPKDINKSGVNPLKASWVKKSSGAQEEAIHKVRDGMKKSKKAVLQPQTACDYLWATKETARAKVINLIIKGWYITSFAN